MSSYSSTEIENRTPNDIDSDSFLFTFDNGRLEGKLTVVKAKEIARSVQLLLFDMFLQNMKDMYAKSSFGYHRQSKWEELFHYDSRIIICRLVENCSYIGFVSYRMECDSQEEKYVFCYEFQVSKQFQGLGIGQRMIEYLEAQARREGGYTIYLTVFRCNERALKFYKRYGYKEIENDPQKDYINFSKIVV